jgi:hypothetical protein
MRQVNSATNNNCVIGRHSIVAQPLRSGACEMRAVQHGAMQDLLRSRRLHCRMRLCRIKVGCRFDRLVLQTDAISVSKLHCVHMAYSAWRAPCGEWREMALSCMLRPAQPQGKRGHAVHGVGLRGSRCGGCAACGAVQYLLRSRCLRRKVGRRLDTLVLQTDTISVSCMACIWHTARGAWRVA